MPSPRLAVLAAACVAATPALAQAPDPARWVAEADSLQQTDANAALALVRRALPLLSADAETRMRALALRCWIAAEAAPDSLLAFSAAGLADPAAPANPRDRADLRVCRGYALDQAGRGQEALVEYEAAAAEGARLRDPKVEANALVLRGEARYYRGEFSGAVRDLTRAHALFRQLRDARQERYALNAIANLYADSRVAQYDRAIEYYRQVLASNKAAGSLPGVATAYFNLGATFERQGRLGDALAHYRRGLAMDLRRGDAGEVATDRRAVGIVLYKLDRPAEALVELDRALAYFRGAGDTERVAQARLSRAVALRMLGRADEALQDLEAARARFESTGNQRFLEKVQEERALAFAAGGRWREAYEARTAQGVLQRALGEQGRDEQSSRLRVEFDAEKKERENRALQRENALRAQALAASGRVRTLQLAVLGLSAVVIAALGLLVWRQLRHGARLRVTALTDELTRLPNRRHLLALAEDQVRGVRARGGSFGVVALDVDHFKAINDRYGHDTGDGVLRRVAEVARASLRQGDELGRTGGEEFVALLPGARPADAAEVAERIRLAIEGADFTDVHPALSVTVSAGATAWRAGDESFAATWKRADDTLYRAKAAGRNRVETAAG